MFQKRFLQFLSIALVSFVSGVAALGQTGPVAGVVKLQKADGTTEPVAGAVVEAFRSDIDRGKMPETKTNKRGEFTFIGFPLGQRFIIAVSGPGIGPRFQPDVKAGTENLTITVNEGDGSRLTEAEVREAAKSVGNAPASGQTSEADKKERAELLKKNAEIDAANKRAEATNKLVNEAMKAGVDAYKALNYDGAIAEFDRGIQADPEFVGSAPVFLNYKGLAHQKRALAAYNSTTQSDAAAKLAAQEKIKSDLSSAFTSFNRGLEIIDKAPATVTAELKNVPTTRMQILSNMLDTYGYAARISPDPTRDATAGAILEQYITAETDVTKRNAALLTFASNMNGAGELKTAAAAYRKVLQDAPDNPDALVGLGLALYSEGSLTSPPNKEALQEGLNYMQRFVDTAPDTHKLKESTKAIIEELKNEQKLAPQKTPPRRRG
jgi:tetratricopeptide (TPR) repeat protein